MAREVKLKGKSFPLVGKELVVGKKIPDCTVVNKEMEDVKLSSLFGGITLLITVPSLDTSVCSVEAKRFNSEAALMSSSVKLLLVSMDLPFAQQRFCGAESVTKLEVLSDFRHREVGEKCGLLIKGFGLLARAVCVIDQGGVVRYQQIVEEVTNEPDYDRALEEIDHLLSNV